MRKIFGPRRRRTFWRWLPVAAVGVLAAAQGGFALPGDGTPVPRVSSSFATIADDQTETPRRGPDKDCRDFDSHDEAQAFFEAQGESDPHRLDGDDDGIACERLR